MKNIKNNKFISLVFLFLTFLTLIVFTKDIFFELQENIDLKKQLNAKLQKNEKIYSDLRALKEELAKEIDTDLEKYLSPFSEDKITHYIHSYVQGNPEVNISQISINPGKGNEYGFIEGHISLDVRVLDENALLDFIGFLVGEESKKYKFFIESLSYNYESGSFNVTIPLTVFYK